VIGLDLMRSRSERFSLAEVLPLAGHRTAIAVIRRHLLSTLNFALPCCWAAELCYFL
jgi:hypothetical protein